MTRVVLKAKSNPKFAVQDVDLGSACATTSATATGVSVTGVSCDVAKITLSQLVMSVLNKKPVVRLDVLTNINPVMGATITINITYTTAAAGPGQIFTYSLVSTPANTGGSGPMWETVMNCNNFPPGAVPTSVSATAVANSL